MITQFSRTQMLLGKSAIEKLNSAKVIVFGVGGVGGYVCEVLARAGVGSIDVVDNDVISLTNINRQIIALHSTVGRSKVGVIKERMLDINPCLKVEALQEFYCSDTAEKFDLSKYTYVVDAIDTVSAKLLLVEECKRVGVPIISSMGTGNKMDPMGFWVTDIYKTSGCPLARVMRRELRSRGIKKLTVVYSPEEVKKPLEESEEHTEKRGLPGTVPFVPPAAGLLIGKKVIDDILENG